MGEIVYLWKDAWGETHISPKKPTEIPSPMGGMYVPTYEVCALIRLKPLSQED